MAYRFQKNTESVDWNIVSELLYHFRLNNLDADTQKKVFENSYAVIFVFDDDKLIGFGRALSDGICQAAIYNIALNEAYHGKGLGKAIINELVEQVKGCNIILYTHPNSIGLYEHLGFRRMKTGMALYQPRHLLKLEEMGFI
ncbi:GNAT family N-acetyltransferase [Clostridium aminobutyricum]|uniref:GNAT family N-acetyltransferase n=1 Tax=Clostridium aminobutyricum TaxID=33953 RepID=A0A939D638_CLOAM|nr:GNAT family N-acetyltransferase [Clostridium aminobutyricum]MBN7771750.1 GNAT family N-acetyltransferase [Clostridium aminobutyricum]